jgi:hypothetical protein
MFTSNAYPSVPMLSLSMGTTLIAPFENFYGSHSFIVLSKLYNHLG